MVGSDPGSILDRLSKHLTGATRLDSLSESFSIYVYDAIKEALNDVDVRLLLHETSLDTRPLNGLGQEHVLRSHLDQHRIAADLAEWAQKHVDVRSLTRRARQSWLTIDGPFPYAVDDAGLDAETLGLVATEDLLFPEEITDTGDVEKLAKNFEKIWHGSSDPAREFFLKKIDQLQRDNPPEDAYLRILTQVFKDFVDEAGDGGEDKEAIGFYDSVVWTKLYKFQRDGVLGAIEKLEKHNGCILADSVGLGKTFEALAVIKHYELKNDRVLVLAPKRLRENWTLYNSNDRNNPLEADRLRYNVLNHTDLSRTHGTSGDINLATINWGNYDLVVIDESHNFRNNPQVKDRTTRYERLMNEVLKAGVKTKVLMLSATPVNTRLADLKNQVLFATEGDDTALKDSGIKSIESTLRKAQVHFNAWQKKEPGQRTADGLIKALGMDYIRLLDLVTIARSRKHIEKYYGIADVGRFPKREAPVNLKPAIDAEGRLMPLERINEKILLLNLAAYKPTSYVNQHSAKYADLYDQHVKGGSGVWKQTDRDNNVVHLLRVGLLKRLESSVNSLALTVEKILHRVERQIAAIDDFEAKGGGVSIGDYDDLADLKFEDQELDDIVTGGKVTVLLADIDRTKWRQQLEEDRKILQGLHTEIVAVDAVRDNKLAELKQVLRDKATKDNRKALIFTAYSDTADYLYANIADWAKDELGLESALITGGTTKTTLKLKNKGMHDVLSRFSPRSKAGDETEPQIDIVIATDTISEGQNLQDCDTVINYDIHWNPVRIVQRFGRVDRLGTKNESVHLVNFWPAIDLEEYIKLESRVSGRMTLLDVSATGEENVLDGAEMKDLDYRRKQLEQMQAAAPTMEDLAGGLSITDLTLSDFRMDVTSRPRKQLAELKAWPQALFGVARFDQTLSSDGLAPGAVFLLKIRDEAIKLADDYPMAPWILAYVTDEGEVKHALEQPKLALDVLRRHCLDQTAPDNETLDAFHKATKHGRDMNHYRSLLAAVVDAATGRAREAAVESLFSPGASTLGVDETTVGLDAIDVVAWVAIVP